MTKNIGIVFADEMEFSPFENYALERGGKKGEFRKMNSVSLKIKEGDRTLNITAAECGIGKANAASATAFLIADGADFILNAGLSGAVSGLKRGDFVAGESYVECDFDLTAIGYEPGAKPGQATVNYAGEKLLELTMQSAGMRKGALGTGDIFLADKVKKDYYYKTFGICSFDMESAAIASVCARAEIPMLSLRKISDDADDSASGDYKEMNDRAEDSLTMVLDSLFARILKDKEIWR